jgi:hypothetical protein
VLDCIKPQLINPVEVVVDRAEVEEMMGVPVVVDKEVVVESAVTVDELTGGVMTEVVLDGGVPGTDSVQGAGIHSIW